MWKNPELRADARFHLKGAWGYGVAIGLITIIAGYIFNMISGAITGGTSILTGVLPDVTQPSTQIDIDLGQFMRNVSDFIAGNWIYFAISSLLTVLFGILFTDPFQVSSNNWFIRNREVPNAPSLELLLSHFTGNYGRLVIGRLWEKFWLFLWGLPILAGVAINMLSLFYYYMSIALDGVVTDEKFTNQMPMFLLGMGLMLLGMIPYINRSFAYAMNQFILADNPQIGHKRSLNLSKSMMKGNKLHYWGLNLSFLGWAFLSLFTCGIGLLFLNPYMRQTMAELYSRLRSVAVGDGITTMEEMGFRLDEEPVEVQQPEVTNPYSPDWKSPSKHDGPEF